MKKLLCSFLLLGLQMAVGSAWADEDWYTDEIDGTKNVRFSFPVDSHWRSYCSAYNLHFNGSYDSDIVTPDEGDCYAFVALSKGYDSDDNIVINLHHMQYVRKETGIWLWGNRGDDSAIAEIISDDDYNDNCTDDDISCIADNKLVGTLRANELTLQDGDYFLVSTDDKAHSATDSGAASANVTMPANTALLRLGREYAHAPLRLSVGDDEEELSIDAVCTEEGELIIYDPNLPSYDLQGRLIDGHAPGVHIQHGYRFYYKKAF